MNHAQAVSELWRHSDPVAPDECLTLVRYATLAASSHNTQPWKFITQPGRITIAPDPSRRCPAVDPDDHHLYASLGCAAENLLLAAEAFGLRATYSYDPSAGVHLDLEPAPAVRSALFEAIPKRQCTRAQYDGRSLRSDELRHIEGAARGDGVSLTLFTDPKSKERIAEFVAEGNRVQFGDARWSAEMASWIRFNARDAVRTGDGLYGPAFGFPDVPRQLGKLLMRFGASAERQNRKDIAHVRSSGAIAVLVSDRDDERHWIEAGRCYQRLALQAAALDLRTAFINQPVEVSSVRRDFAGFLGMRDGRPDLIIRIGRGPEMPRSLRRPLADVIEARTPREEVRAA